jgi:hypothetical protein
MKGVLTAILMSVAILLAISSCATVPKEPLGPGELRLLSLYVPENGNLKTGIAYRISINFEADGKPEIRRACFTWSGDGPYCVRVKDVKYGSDAYIELPFYARPDTNRLDCYVEYVRDGKIRRTNTVLSYVTGMM